MRLEHPYQSNGLNPKALAQFFMILGLAMFSIFLIKQKIILAIFVVFLPLGVAALGYGLIFPRFIYLLYATYAFFFTTISRYLLVNQLSAGLEAILFYGMISLIFSSMYKKGAISWRNAINILTISYIPWVFFTLYQFTNSAIRTEGVAYGIRIWIFRVLVLYIFLSILSNTYKALRVGLDLVAFFTFLAFVKLMWQKYIGFDQAEQYWLYVGGGSTTHIISSGVRYFSYFTDSANFGCYMAATSLIYTIIGFHIHNKPKKLYYLIIGLISFISMFLSGTRGALIIPLIGAMLYCLLCKNIRIFVITGLTGVLIFFFFSYTTIGESNPYIRRARTAFKSSEDASMNVRYRNREEIADFIAQHPLGAGIAGVIPKLWMQPDGTYQEGTLPSDSFFVNIWIQTGYVGLALYILICAIVIIGASMIVLFRIRSPLIRHIMAALTCATFGIWVSGYTGNNPGMPPTDFLIAAMMAFVMNGSTIDKDYLNHILTTSKTNNAI